jgi:hypothetical protein
MLRIPRLSLVLGGLAGVGAGALAGWLALRHRPDQAAGTRPFRECAAEAPE